MLKTGVITYNLAERGRKARGQDRNLDLAMAAKLINSPAVQEMVAQGDMIGWYGHWPREKFGINVVEGAVVNGQAVALVPAIRTVRLKAYDDGTVEHETEFLDTAPGKIAARNWQSKVGGFSSAMLTKAIGGKAVATTFAGFDYVLEPNYTKNRGYSLALDAVAPDSPEHALLMDALERQQELEHAALMLDSLQGQYDSLLASVAHLGQENEYYRERLIRTGMNLTVLDAVRELRQTQAPHPLLRADEFATAKLAGYQKVEDPTPKTPGLFGGVLARLGL